MEAAGGGGWLPRSTRVGEVDLELSELLGMSAEQFHQVVLLPQGQFAKFLHSDASERTALLQRLFGTDRFRRIEDWLAEQRRQSKEAFDQARHGVRRLIARVRAGVRRGRARSRRGRRAAWVGGASRRSAEVAACAPRWRPRRRGPSRRRRKRRRSRRSTWRVGSSARSVRSRGSAALSPWRRRGGAGRG